MHRIAPIGAAVALTVTGCAGDEIVFDGGGGGKADDLACRPGPARVVSRRLDPPAPLPDSLVGADIGEAVAERSAGLELASEQHFPDDARPELDEDVLRIYRGGDTVVEHGWKQWADGERDDTVHVYRGGERIEFFADFGGDGLVNWHDLYGPDNLHDEDDDRDGVLDVRSVDFHPARHDVDGYGSVEAPDRIARVILEDTDHDGAFDLESLVAASGQVFQVRCE